MAKPLPKDEVESAVDPALIVQQTFKVERRGYDQDQVRSYLRAVADSLQDAQRRESEMRTRVGKAIRRAEAAEKSARNARKNDDVEANRQVGDDVAAVLEAAQATSEQRIAAAETSAAQILARAKEDATATRAEAAAVLEERRTEAEIVAADVLAECQSEIDALRAEVQAEIAGMRSGAGDRIEQVRDDCDELIREAEEARAQILEDMERRRRQARAQVERLRVGRDRLLRSYEVVRRTLEETTVELKSSLQEAKVRGDSAAREVMASSPANREQLEAELADAKLIGIVQIPEKKKPVREVRSAALPRRLDPPQLPSVDLRADAAPAARKSTAAAPASAKSTPAKTPASKAGSGKPRATVPMPPKAPPVAPVLTPTVEIDEAIAAALDREALDLQVEQLADDNLNVVEPADDIEEVVALAADSAIEDGKSDGLFDELRAQRSAEPAKKTQPAKKKAPSKKKAQAKKKPAAKKTVAKKTVAKNEPEAKNESPAADAAAETPATPEAEPVKTAKPASEQPDVVVQTAAAPATSAQADSAQQMANQRDAVIAEAAKQLEKRLKRALADEQNDLLATIRSTKRNKKIELTQVVGDVDMHVSRYVAAINHVAVVTYGAGAALIDAEPGQGQLPAGAVEELLQADVVGPIRERLVSLDAQVVDTADLHIDPVRAFYRERKTDHLGVAASRLAQLLCVAGVCDSLPSEAALPWAPPTTN